MILYWESHSEVIVTGWLQHYFAVTTAVAQIPAGIWVVAPNYQIIHWQDNTDALFSGSIRGITAVATGTPAVGAIYGQRSIMRFVFSRIMGRVN